MSKIKCDAIINKADGTEIQLDKIADIDAVNNKIDTKVDIVTGKELSDNNFTDALKTLIETKKVKDITTDDDNDLLVITYTDDTTVNLDINNIITNSSTSSTLDTDALFHLDGHNNIGTSYETVGVTDAKGDLGTTSLAPDGITTTTNDFTTGDTTSTLYADSSLLQNFTSGGEPWTISAYTYITSRPGTSALCGINKTDDGSNTAEMLFGYGSGVKQLNGAGDLLTISGDDWDNLYTNVWTKWDFVYDGTSIYCYINGDLKNTVDYASEPYNTSSLLIGNESDGTALEGSGNLFPGYISDFKFYDKAINI